MSYFNGQRIDDEFPEKQEPAEKTYPLTAKQISDLWDAGQNYIQDGFNERVEGYLDKATYLKQHFNIDIKD